MEATNMATDTYYGEYVKKMERLARAESVKLDRMSVETANHEKTIRSYNDQVRYINEDKARHTETLHQAMTALKNELAAIEKQYDDRTTEFVDKATTLADDLVSFRHQKRTVVRMGELLQVLKLQADDWRIWEAGKFVLGGSHHNNWLGRWHIEDIEARNTGIYVKTTIGKEYRKVLDLNDLYDIKMVRANDVVLREVRDYTRKTGEDAPVKVAGDLKENAKTQNVHFTYEV
jgi:hypothetical protein